MSRIALTGFEAFQGFPVNPSGELAKSVEAPDGVELVRRVFPVRFKDVRGTYTDWLAEVQPDAVLNLGLAARRGWVSPERFALRLGVEPDLPAPDDPDAPLDLTPPPDFVPLHELDGPPARETCLDTESLAERLRSAGVPAAPSHHAGTYLCNFMYYLSLQALGSRRALFLHVPFDREQAIALSRIPAKRVPSLERALLEQAVSICLRSLAS